ncbi:MAG: ABC transporter substrate-binding protein [Spirochaetes bacterium]|nr:ABC transporter substrate-binding protein [Spirochaetota bacterium]
MKQAKWTFPLFVSMLILGGVSRQISAEPSNTLVLGLMPAVNIAPIIVAEAEGFFQQEGVSLRIELFKNQMYRESALQTGTIDGTVSDLINAVNAVSNGFPLKVTSASEGIFGLVAAPRSRFPDASSWKNAPPSTKLKVGLLENSIVYYVTERMLETRGIRTNIIELVSSPQLPARMEMLLAGRIDAACLPEPLLSLSRRSGATVVADTESLPFTPGVILFTEKALKAKPLLVKAFYRGYNRGVAMLLKDPERWKPMILEKAEFPPTTKEFSLPVFAPARLTRIEEYRDVTSWMRTKGLLSTIPPYEAVVDGAYLP